MAQPDDEPRVHFFSPMPAGYQFLKKGDVYMTGHCRKRTQAAGQRVYVVVDKNKKVVGLRCPTAVVRAVAADAAATAATRAAAVRKRDSAIENEFEKALLHRYPLVPRDAVPTILAHTLRKRSGRVGRTSTASLHDKVRLAVVAHIRHCHTNYEQQLRDGVGREEVRKNVWPAILAIAQSWEPPRRQQERSKDDNKNSGNAKQAGRETTTPTVQLLPKGVARPVLQHKKSRNPATPTRARGPVTAKTVLKPRDTGKVKKRLGGHAGGGTGLRRSSRTIRVPDRLIDEVLG